MKQPTKPPSCYPVAKKYNIFPVYYLEKGREEISMSVRIHHPLNTSLQLTQTTAPKPISQHIIITHAPATPQVDVEAAPTPLTRHSVPKHLLKHRFLPYGAASSDTSIQRAAHALDVDVEDDLGNNEEFGGKKAASTVSVEKTRTPKKTSPRSLQKLAEKSGKKRKQEVTETDTPGQKSKKLKT